MGSSVTVKAPTEQVTGAESLYGKVLCKLIKAPQGDGLVACFGDSKDSSEGPILYIRFESKEDSTRVGLLIGDWKDKEKEVV